MIKSKFFFPGKRVKMHVFGNHSQMDIAVPINWGQGR